MIYYHVVLKGKNRGVSVATLVAGADDCPVKGITVTATINGKGNRFVSVSHDSQETDDDGLAVFTIHTKDKKGTAVITFQASGLDKVATVQVKVRECCIPLNIFLQGRINHTKAQRHKGTKN